MDKKKVIKGLEMCNCLTDICYEHDCPYYNGVVKIFGETEDVGYSSDDCMEKLNNDALALLKEQEGTINELQNAYGYLQKQFFEAQDKLLKEQEAVKPTWSRGNPFCGACGLRIRGGKFCSECGKPIAWEDR